MRIVIDMQGAQTESRFRGIGRYSLAFVQAIICQSKEHEVFLALNGMLHESIESIRAAFDGFLPQENIRVWYAPGPVKECEVGNDRRRKPAELVREAFIASLNPDIVHMTSLFEGYVDDAVTSIKTFDFQTPVSVSFYDLIPLLDPKSYLNPNPVYEAYYHRKISHLKRADLLLGISGYSTQEALDNLQFEKSRCVNVSTAVDSRFKPVTVDPKKKTDICKRYNIQHEFVMYAGGVDSRKNVEGLIRSYAGLSKDVRAKHQLVLVCNPQPGERKLFEEIARKAGLKKDEYIFTGHVTDEELVIFYNLCNVFVFPSFHEGFGLPAVEAMSCGRAVIGSNVSSLPEVIGLDEALFDPKSDKAITALIQRALTDEIFRKKLEKHGPEQAKKFSWDESAKRAIAAFEKLHDQQKKQKDNVRLEIKRPKLAFVSPLPPERSGISDYSAELLPELDKYYDIEIISAQSVISDPYIKANYPIRTVDWFRENSTRYDRVLYQFGNSPYHQHMFRLLEEIPGVVVSHDFYLSSLIEYMDSQKIEDMSFVRELYYSHGYKAMQEGILDPKEARKEYPCNLRVLQNALGVIVHSNHFLMLNSSWYGLSDGAQYAKIPLLRNSIISNHLSVNDKFDVYKDDFVICTFGFLDHTKLNDRLLDAWLASKFAKDKNCKLIFVGENPGGSYGQKLKTKIQKSQLRDRIQITGWIDINTYRQYLGCADMAVQLRALSRGETSASVLDCMNYGIPTIVNANGSMTDLPDDGVWKLKDEFSDKELIAALETLWKDKAKRDSLGKRAREIILTQHSPQECARQYFKAIERYYQETSTSASALVSMIHNEIGAKSIEWSPLLESISTSIPVSCSQRQLFVDISALVQTDLKSGIERVVRSFLTVLIENSPSGYRVEPVYATTDRGYCYARKFMLNFMDCSDSFLQDEPVVFQNGDVFLGLELHQYVVCAHQEFYQKLRNHGVQVYFVVYDLLPILLPRYFPQTSEEIHQKWLSVVAQSDGVVCISKAVADEFEGWMKEFGPQRLRPLKVSWFHLGADIENSVPTKGMPEDAWYRLKKINEQISFLMVGTVEPRKGHRQTLKAFEELWKKGVDVSLAIVGKQGWMMDDFADSLRTHKEFNKRLFWFEGISDEYLEKIYEVSNCLISASEGEGFGLPLIEAAQKKMPIIARDIPVFKEVVGSHGFYFSGLKPEDLSRKIEEWLKLHALKKHPTSDKMPWITWEESAKSLLKHILPSESTSETSCGNLKDCGVKSQSSTGVSKSAHKVLGKGVMK